MNTTMADGAEQRLDAQIAEALFGQPGMSKMDVANRVRELRGDGPALLVPREEGQSERVRFEAWLNTLSVDTTRWGDGEYTDTAAHNYWLAWQTALSAQPSPGGQGGLNYERMFVDACAALAEVSRELGCDPEQGGAEPILAAIAELQEALAARQPVESNQPSGNSGELDVDGARQPVGQEPVGAEVEVSDASVEKAWGRFQQAMALTDDEIEEFASAHSDEMGDIQAFAVVDFSRALLREFSSRYASQPAQAVDLDLGRVRASLQSLLNWIDDWAETPEESGIDAIEAEAEAVLALIDGKAVGNGTDR